MCSCWRWGRRLRCTRPATPCMAHYVALGTVLAAQMSLLARPVAGFSILLPVAYAAAAITAQSTGGVIALIVAVAAIVGAASSQGLQRGLLAVLAATLIGSSEPAAPSAVLAPTLALFVGSCFGYLLAKTSAARRQRGRTGGQPPDGAELRNAAGGPRAGRMACVACRRTHARLVDSIRGRRCRPSGHFRHGPALARGPRRNVARHARAGGRHRAQRCRCRAGGLPDRTVTGSSHRREDAAVAPRAALHADPGAAGHPPGGHPPVLEYLQSALLACAAVFGVALLGQWLLWTIRPDPGHAAA